MTEMMTVKQAAALWNISERRVSGLCQGGKIQGAAKSGRSWMIPQDAQKPADKRIKSGNYRKTTEPLLSLPIGISDYSLASSQYYYVDKTLMIKDIIDELPLVSLYTRPRRFGKTLNMSMIRTFFEKSDTDTSIYFKNKKIWQCGKKYQDYQGKFPVVFLTFKDIKYETWDETIQTIKNLLTQEAYRHSDLRDSEKCNAYEKEYFEKILTGKANEIELSAFFLNISAMLRKHYGIAPIIIIDEYDIPIQQAYICGFYDQVIRFMHNLFSGAFKDNPNITFGFLTGIFHVAKESIFSGMNNLSVSSVLDNKYSEYFGFTPEEVKTMAAYYGVSEKYDEICEWYDGYQFGKTEIFNPWSVINYFSNQCEPRPFWQNTGSNEIISEIITESDIEIYDKLRLLICGKSFPTYIDTGVIYPQIKNNSSSIFSYLLAAGYLKSVNMRPSISGDFVCEVSLPNREITYVYNKEILQKLDHIIPVSSSASIQEAIYAGDGQKLQRELQKIISQSVNFYDASNESFYHKFMLGLCTLFNESYTTSNRESGDGRFDIQLFPNDHRLPGILLELKFVKDYSEDQLDLLAQDALRQIIDKKYDAEMIAHDIVQIYKYGVAFSGKHVSIAALKQIQTKHIQTVSHQLTESAPDGTVLITDDSDRLHFEKKRFWSKN